AEPRVACRTNYSRAGRDVCLLRAATVALLLVVTPLISQQVKEARGPPDSGRAGREAGRSFVGTRKTGALEEPPFLTFVELLRARSAVEFRCGVPQRERPERSREGPQPPLV